MAPPQHPTPKPMPDCRLPVARCAAARCPASGLTLMKIPTLAFCLSPSQAPSAACCIAPSTKAFAQPQSDDLTGTMAANWFKNAFGFPEGKYEETRSRFHVEEDKDGSVTLTVKSSASGEKADAARGGRSFHVGKFDTPSVSELRDMLDEITPGTEFTQSSGGGLTFRHVVADVASLHRDPANEGSVFQAASQFNCLEMPSPKVTPDDGITNYCWDRTQGPACAMACPAGTLFRNYFVGGNGQGGELGKQLDTLSDVGKFLEEKYLEAVPDAEKFLGKKYWKMKNGYALPVSSRSIAAMKADVVSGKIDMENAREKLRVGVHWSTEVARATGTEGQPFNVAQVYCSAVPIAYDYTASKADWEPLARLCLNGSYEATLAVAAILARRGNRRIRAYLTKVGGGAFGNSDGWISDAIKMALDVFKAEPIDVYLVHYGAEEEHYTRAIDRIGRDSLPDADCEWKV